MTVLLACPTYRLEPETVDALLAIRSHAAGEGFGLDLWFGTDNPHPVTPDKGARNMLHQQQRARRVCLSEGYDGLFMVESDVIPPANALVRLAALLDDRADVAYGWYRFRPRDGTKRDVGHNLRARYTDEPGGCRNTGPPLRGQVLEEAMARGTYPVSGSGLGCLLIRREVLEQIPFRWEGSGHTDGPFTRDVWRHGFEQWADLRVRCGHKQPSGNILWPPELNAKVHA